MNADDPSNASPAPAASFHLAADPGDAPQLDEFAEAEHSLSRRITRPSMWSPGTGEE